MKYVILSRPHCIWCEKAKELLGDEAVVIESFDAFQFVKEGGFGSFPQIFHNGKHIGGYSELLDYHPQMDQPTLDPAAPA